MTSGLRAEDHSVAGGLSQLPQFVGAIGTAGLAAIVTARTHTLSATASRGGLHTAMLTAGAVCLLGAAVAVLFLRRPLSAAPRRRSEGGRA